MPNKEKIVACIRRCSPEELRALAIAEPGGRIKLSSPSQLQAEQD